jgi:hypothetical protein
MSQENSFNNTMTQTVAKSERIITFMGMPLSLKNRSNGMQDATALFLRCRYLQYKVSDKNIIPQIMGDASKKCLLWLE